MAPSQLGAVFFARLMGNLTFPDVSLEGRTIIVTGANQGLGLEAARHFATLSPSRLILAVRRVDAGQTAANDIAKTTGLARERVEVWQLDLASFASVKAFGDRAHKELERVDVACLNAAVAGFKWEQTVDGWERMLQVNDISTGLLAVELLPLLLKAADLPPPAGGDSILKPHLTIVSSEVHYWAKFAELESYKSGKNPSILAVLNDQTVYGGFDRYNISKLLNVFLVREFNKLPQVRGKVVVNAVCPGFTQSSLRNEAPWPIAGLMNLLARPTANSAKNLVFASLVDTSSAEYDPEGAFVSHCKVQPPSDFVLSDEGKEVSKKVFEEMKEEWGKVDAEAVKEVFQ
ncbi:hypothetical protein JCM8097_008917 [Rhodosporidiobolus ruineniae]